MWLELKTVFDRLSTDSSVRVIIFTGAGERAFTAGLDVQAASDSGVGSRTASGDGARAATALRRSILNLQDCVSSIEKCEKRTHKSISRSRRSPLVYPYADS